MMNNGNWLPDDVGFAIKKDDVPVAFDGQTSAHTGAEPRYAAKGHCSSVWSALGPADVTLCWDNTYSLLRSKTVTFTVRIFAVAAPAEAEVGGVEPGRRCPYGVDDR